MVSRPVPWVSTVLYGAVLFGGVYFAIVADGPHRPARLAGLVGGIAALFALEFVERRRYPTRAPTGPAVVLLCVRVVLIVGVALLDSSGVSRALLVLVPFTAYFAFGRTVSLALGASCVGLLALTFTLTVPRWWLDAEYVSDLLMFALGLLLAISMAAVAIAEQRERATVAELAATAERLRLARDIHDSLGHHLTAVAVQLQKASAFLDRDRAVAEQALADAELSTRNALGEVRRSVAGLREETMPFRLSVALAELAHHAEDDALRVRVEVTGDEGRYDLATLTALYRAAQEGLTNARRHGHASYVWLSATMDESAARLVVADDGRGFAPTTAGFGLRGMRERVALLGGNVNIDSTPGTSTTITVTIPVTA